MRCVHRSLAVLVFFFVVPHVRATDVRDIVGMAHMGAAYWCPSNPQCASLGWYLDGATLQPLAADGTFCYCARDQLNDGADDILAMGSRVIYVKLSGDMPAFYPYNYPHYVTKFDQHAVDCWSNPAAPPCGRLVNMAKTPPYQALFAKSFTTFFLDIGPNTRLFRTNSSGATEELGADYAAGLGYPD